MNKRGFTLVEVLAVVVVLGIIAGLFIPNVSKILRDNNLKIYKIKESELLKASKTYADYDENFIPPTQSEPARYITMPTLVSKNYMNKILDTKTGNECNAFVKVTLNSVYGYDYEACLICDEYKTDKEFCNSSTYDNL